MCCAAALLVVVVAVAVAVCVGVFWGPLFRQRRRYPTNYPQRTERRSTLPLPVIVVGNGISSLGSARVSFASHSHSQNHSHSPSSSSSAVCGEFHLRNSARERERASERGSFLIAINEFSARSRSFHSVLSLSLLHYLPLALSTPLSHMRSLSLTYSLSAVIVFALCG